jgi:predicted hydrocarbon binding protein
MLSRVAVLTLFMSVQSLSHGVLDKFGCNWDMGRQKCYMEGSGQCHFVVKSD